MAVNIPGAISVAVFYIVILVSGIIAGRKTNKSKTNDSILVADRSLTQWVSVFTITATMVGGAFINGCAEAAASSGLLFTQTSIGYSLCFIPAGLFYAPKMRRENYVTMFDPFQLKYGKKVGALLFLPQFFGDLFWSAATLSALGATVSIILDIDSTLAIIVSAVVAIFYTFCGGLYAVAYTDVFQLSIIALGLILAFPFCLTHEAVDLENSDRSIWGEVTPDIVGSYADVWLLCICGGIPWQALYQRVLACKTESIARTSTLLSLPFTLILATPPVIMGLAGRAADWNMTSYEGTVPLPPEQYAYILPLTLSYLTPTAVGIIGIGAMAAAVMSSADSCFLSSSSVFTKNIYQDIFRPQASEREIMWVLRISILVFGTLGTIVAITVKTIYGLFVLCGDLMYVILLPQLTLILWMQATNSYGCLSAFAVAFLLRILCGEPILGLPAAIQFPMYDEATGFQNFPYRTMVMLLGVAVLIGVSYLTNYLFMNEIIPAKFDFLNCRDQRTIHIKDHKKKEGREMDEKDEEENDNMKKDDARKPMISAGGGGGDEGVRVDDEKV